VTLLLRPPGRGNWQLVVVTIEGLRNAPLPIVFARGQRIEFGGLPFRIVGVTS
jgi:hypothetical protein